MNKRIVFIALICIIVNLPGLGAAVADTHNAQREAGRRLALVIGNDAYEAAPLQAARNDARSMARVLTELGFSVTLLQDATREMIASALATMGGKIRPDDVVLFYFSGHGAQMDGENFLVPVDFKSFTSEALRLGTIRANEVLKIFERARVTILVLDACRVNPFSGDRAGGRGLAAMEARGSLIAFGAGSEQVALDGPRDGNGAFTSALLKELKEPGLSVQEVFRRARQRVYQDTNGKQFPAVYDGLIGDFTFLAQPPAALPSPPPKPESNEMGLLDLRGISKQNNYLFVVSVPDSGTISYNPNHFDEITHLLKPKSNTKYIAPKKSGFSGNDFVFAIVRDQELLKSTKEGKRIVAQIQAHDEEKDRLNKEFQTYLIQTIDKIVAENEYSLILDLEHSGIVSFDPSNDITKLVANTCDGLRISKEMIVRPKHGAILGIVDAQKILEESKQGKLVVAQIVAKDKELQAKVSSKQITAKEARKQMDELTSRLFSEFQNDLIPIIEGIRNDKGLIAILDKEKSGFPYFDSSTVIDLTDLTIEKINQRH